MFTVPIFVYWFLWIAQNNRQPLLSRADDDNLGVLASRQFPCRLDALPFQQIVVQALVVNDRSNRATDDRRNGAT